MPDGRFVMVPEPFQTDVDAMLDATMPSQINVVQNWFAELEAKVPR